MGSQLQAWPPLGHETGEGCQEYECLLESIVCLGLNQINLHLQMAFLL